jgi:hypothetical protein
MKRIAKITGITATILLFTLLLGIVSSRTVRASVTSLIVTIANTSANPVPISDAREPVLLSCSNNNNSQGQATNACSLNAPAGKRLEIDTVSFFIFVDQGVSPIAEELLLRLGASEEAGLFFTIPSNFGSAGGNYFAGTQQVKAVVDGGTSGGGASIPCTIALSAPSNANVLECSVTGYLTDMP